MTTVDSTTIKKQVSVLLNDQGEDAGYVRWSEDDIDWAFNEALSAIAMARPDTSVTTVDVTLVAGAMQTIPDACAELVSVIGSLDENGNVASQADKGSNSLTKWFPGCIDTSSSTYKLGSYSIDESNPNIFYVSPPVAQGQTVTVKVNCQGGCDAATLDCRFQTPLIEFMLYRLLSQEDDSSTSGQTAAAHLNTFIALLGLNYQMRELLKEPDQNVNAPATGQN